MRVLLNVAAKRFRSLPWDSIKKDIAGKHFDVSVALVSGQDMRRIRRTLHANKKTKPFAKKHKSITVLSFLLGEKEGEIILNKDLIRKEAKHMRQPFRERLLYLYIHGLLHLKGYDHKNAQNEKAMKQKEEQLFVRFSKS